MSMLALRLFLKDKGGGKQQCLIPVVGSNLGVETFLKKLEDEKSIHYNRVWGTSVYFPLRFQENSM